MRRFCTIVVLAFMAWTIHGADPYLVAIILTGNSTANVVQPVGSVIDVVDAVVLINTGSTDDALGIAEQVAGDKVIVKDMIWPGSLEEARNAALRIGADVGATWGVVIDTNDIFEGSTSHVKGLLKQTEADLVKLRASSSNSSLVCFHRLPPKGTYTGPAHEQLVTAPGFTSKVIVDVQVLELLRCAEGLRSNAQPDIDFLEKCTAHDPFNARSWCLLGEAYTATKRHAEAVKAYEKCFNSSTSDEEAAIAMYKAATNWASLERYDEAIKALMEGMNRHPAIPELPWFAAYVSYQVGRHQAAADWARLAVVHGCYSGTCPVRAGFEYPFARYEGPYDMLQWSLRALGDMDGAMAAARHTDKAIVKRELASTSDARGQPAHQDTSETAAQTMFTSINASKPRVGLGFTTSKRPETFKRTYLSFRARCLDCSMIDDWFAVDDGSSVDQLAQMKAIAPHIKWLEKRPEEAGHVGSINTLLKVAADYDYFVWMEDDWYFTKDDYLLSKGIAVLRLNPDVGQVLFNQDFRVTDHEAEEKTVVGGDQYEASGINYVVHKYCGPLGSEEYNQCSRPGKLSSYHWPHFSLNPGVWSMEHMNELGNVEAGGGFEYRHALKYQQLGKKTAFLSGVNAIHLGKTTTLLRDKPYIAGETYAKHGISVTTIGLSAYDLTGTDR